jgi:hypothetical protein
MEKCIVKEKMEQRKLEKAVCTLSSIPLYSIRLIVVQVTFSSLSLSLSLLPFSFLVCLSLSTPHVIQHANDQRVQIIDSLCKGEVMMF